jgi:hypothetical protein
MLAPEWLRVTELYQGRYSILDIRDWIFVIRLAGIEFRFSDFSSIDYRLSTFEYRLPKNKTPGWVSAGAEGYSGNFSRYERLDQQNVKAPAFAAGRVAEARKASSSFMGRIIPN